MIITTLAITLLAAPLSAQPKDKRGSIEIDRQKQEGSVATTKSGDLRVGAGGPKPVSPAPTEADKRRDQQNAGGRVFIERRF